MKIEKAKLKILRRSPFFGSILFNIPIKESFEIPTLCTDGWIIEYNPIFWNSQSDEEQLGLLIHEITHIILKHIWRGKNLKATTLLKIDNKIIPYPLFGIAADYATNSIIEENNYYLPPDYLYKKEYKNKSAEEIYYDLLKKAKKQPSQRFKNNHNKWGINPLSAKQERKLNNLIKNAIEIARTYGKEPLGMERLFNEIEPKVDWRLALKEFIMPYQNDYSFNPVDRRFLGEDFALPSLNEGEQLDWVAIAIDTSGSIKKEEISSFIGEIKGILNSFERVKAKITFCDVNATPFVDIDETHKYKVIGGGGTSFIEPFRLAQQEPELPKVLIYMTDLDGSFPSEIPNFPTIWLKVGQDNKKVPFGTVLKYK